MYGWFFSEKGNLMIKSLKTTNLVSTIFLNGDSLRRKLMSDNNWSTACVYYCYNKSYSPMQYICCKCRCTQIVIGHIPLDLKHYFQLKCAYLITLYIRNAVVNLERAMKPMALFGLNKCHRHFRLCMAQHFFSWPAK